MSFGLSGRKPNGMSLNGFFPNIPPPNANIWELITVRILCSVRPHWIIVLISAARHEWTAKIGDMDDKRNPRQFPGLFTATPRDVTHTSSSFGCQIVNCLKITADSVKGNGPLNALCRERAGAKETEEERERALGQGVGKKKKTVISFSSWASLPNGRSFGWRHSRIFFFFLYTTAGSWSLRPGQGKPSLYSIHKIHKHSSRADDENFCDWLRDVPKTKKKLI